MGSLAAHAKPGSDINILISAFLGTVTVELSSEGEEYDLSETVDVVASLVVAKKEHALDTETYSK